MTQPINSVTDTSAATASAPVETPVVESRPGQGATSPGDNGTSHAPEQDTEDTEPTGLDMLRAAREEEEAARKGTTPASEDSTKAAAATAPATQETPSTPEPEKPIDWQARAAHAESKLNEIGIQRQQAEAEQLNAKQYRDMQVRYTSLKESEDLIPGLEADAREALNIYGSSSDEYKRAYRVWATSKANYESALENYNNVYDRYVADNQKAQENNYVSYIDSHLAAFGQSLKDLKKVNPKLRVGVPGDIISAALKANTDAVTAKYEAKITELNAKVAAAEEKAKAARRRFDTGGAGSRMENLGDTTAGKKSSGFDLSKSAMDYFAEARAESGTPY